MCMLIYKILFQAMSVPIEGRSPASIPVEVSVALHDWGRQLSHLRTIFRNYEDTCTKLYEYLNPSSSALAAHHLEELCTKILAFLMR